MEKIIIAAVSENNVIGKDGKLPWKSKEELKHFRKQTFGYPVIMGRRTYESIDKKLDGRLNVVLSTNLKINEKQIVVFDNFNKSIDYCRKNRFDKIFFIGGESVFKKSIEIADKIILTKFNYAVEGDTFFPEINQKIWQLKDEIKGNKNFSVFYYSRK